MKKLMLVLVLMSCSKPALTPEDNLHIEALGKKLDICKAEGREAGSYQAYEDCKKDAGIK